MKTGMLLVLLILLFCFAFTSGVSAVPVTINIEATVTRVDDSGPGAGWLGGNVSVNDIIKGHYTYESTTPDTFSPPDITIGWYEHYTPPAGIFLSIGGLAFQTDPSQVYVRVSITNNGIGGGGDVYAVRSSNNLAFTPGVPTYDISWELLDYTGNALSSDALPMKAPVLTDWQGFNYLYIDASPSRGGFGIYARVTSAELIPEPATFLLFAAGVAMLRRRCRRE